MEDEEGDNNDEEGDEEEGKGTEEVWVICSRLFSRITCSYEGGGSWREKISQVELTKTKLNPTLPR